MNSPLVRQSVQLLLICVATGSATAFGDNSASIASVNPFIGTDNDGNTIPGPQCPFGFAAPSPDTEVQNTSGYLPNSPIIGFSQTHVSGTGGGGKYGNFRITPQVDEISLSNLASPKDHEEASVGYYQVHLAKPDVLAELTATHYTAIERFTFPAGKPAHLLLDVTSVINPTSKARQTPVDCLVRILPPDRMEGSATFIGGWNPSPYTLHFHAKFSVPFKDWGCWRGNKLEAARLLSDGERTSVGAWASFDTSGTRQVEVRVGLSFKGVAEARAHLDREAEGHSFEQLVAAARSSWQPILDRVAVSGGTADQRAMFYTALYHAHLMPHDLSEENAWWDSSEPHYEDYYCLWDTYRCLNPLFLILEPDRERDLVRSLLDTYAHTGWLPDARIAGANGMSQGGSNGDALVADALVKGLTGIDRRKAFEALSKDAYVQSPRSLFEGRELSDYLQLGYVSLSHPRSASRTLEYAFDDFCVAEVAEATGHLDEARQLYARSRNWENLWDSETRTLRPRLADGRWFSPYSPTVSYSERPDLFAWWEAPYYEGTGLQYTTFVPHEPYRLITKLGGAQEAVRWLDRFFDLTPGSEGPGKDMAYTQGNEPDLLAPYLYLYAHRPDRLQEVLHGLMKDQYSAGRGGLPGNDDAGTMSSWFVWNAVGLYPLAGEPLYFIGTPLFKSAALRLGNGKTFSVERSGGSSKAFYVAGATLNGTTLDRPWITHDELMAGGTLRLQISEAPSNWGALSPPPQPNGLGNLRSQ